MSLRIVFPNKMVISKIEGELPGIEVGHAVLDIVHNSRFEQATIYLENIKDDQEEKKMMEFESKEPQVVKVGDPVDIRPVIRCEYCRFCKEDMPGSPTGHLCSRTFSGFAVKPNDGCTFGHRAVSNEEKFEEVFDISFYEFVRDLKHEDQFQWGKNEYQERPVCED